CDLPNAYRCPPPIMALANGLIDGNPDMELIRRGVEDRTIRLLVAVNGNQYATQTEREITRLISEGLEPGDITMISLAGQSATNTVIKHPELAHQKLVRADAADATAHVVADTFLRFKGLERPAVIVTDLDDLRVNDRMATRLHIALTRALDFVRIVGTAADFEKCDLLADVLKMQQEISSKKAQAEAAAKAEQLQYRK
ncbi:MAG TPA: ATP-binding domain-containing protein, partial [Myxococcota bacterium]|nr:ATP-binding domain-containing protein [Myxococcota bacterium]